MKKFLLATSAAGALLSSAAVAAGPEVTVGGYADFQLGISDQDAVYENSLNTPNPSSTSDLHTRVDAEVHISVDGKTDNGLGYGARIELDANTSADDGASADNANAEKAYIYIKSGFGKLELGSTGDAGDALRVDASSFARATGGIGGDWYQYVDLDNSGVVAGSDTDFYRAPGLPTAVTSEDGTNNKDRAYANKISFYSPRVQGIQGGISFTPDQSERGTSTGFGSSFEAAPGQRSTPSFENVWNLGLNYQGEIEDVSIEASLTGEFGEAKDVNETTRSASDDLSAYALGLNLAYAGVTVGGSWASLDETGKVTANNSDGSYFTVGAAYENGPLGVSVTYLSSEIDNEAGATLDAELTNLSLGADYQLAPGLVPYVEVSFFETDDNNAATTTDNDGSVVIFGTELNF